MQTYSFTFTNSNISQELKFLIIIFSLKCTKPFYNKIYRALSTVELEESLHQRYVFVENWKEVPIRLLKIIVN